MAETILPDKILEFKVIMKKVMDGEDNKVMIENIAKYLEVSATSEHKDFAEKVTKLPFSLKEQYKILYCALYEERLKKIHGAPPPEYLDAIKKWKEANGLDCSHLYKPEDDESTKVRREIIYILHNISLE